MGLIYGSQISASADFPRPMPQRTPVSTCVCPGSSAGLYFLSAEVFKPHGFTAESGAISKLSYTKRRQAAPKQANGLILSNLQVAPCLLNGRLNSKCNAKPAASGLSSAGSTDSNFTFFIFPTF